MFRMRFRLMLVATTLVAAPIVSLAQNGDLAHQHPATQDAMGDFRVFPVPAVPGGVPPVLQAGGIGGPLEPCACKLPHLTPEEVTIVKGGEVTFQIHGGGHAM